VQEERQKLLSRDDHVLTSIVTGGLHASVLLDAELAAESADVDAAEFAELMSDDDVKLCDAIDKHLMMLVAWSRHLPPFTLLPLADQVLLLRAGQHISLCLSIRLSPGLLCEFQKIFASNSHFQASFEDLLLHVILDVSHVQRIRDLLVMRYINVRFTDLLSVDVSSTVWSIKNLSV